MDLVYVGIVIGFFGVAWGMVSVCGKLAGGGGR